MKTIWKYSLAHQGSQVIEIPRGATILTVQTQNAAPCLWAIVDTEAEKEWRKFEIRGTGTELNQQPPDTRLEYIGTFQESVYVWHVFESKPYLFMTD